MRAIIIAAGEGSRWGNHLGVEKHFVEIDKEPIICRTVRLLYEQEIKDIWVVGRNDKYKIEHSKLYIPELNPKNHDADKFLSSKDLWSKTERTLVLYGDVFFTENAIKKMVHFKHRDWLLFARPFASEITGCGYGECWAQGFWPDHIREHEAALHKLVKYYEEGRLDRIGGWEHYRIMIGIPENIIYRQLIGDRFVEINDWTEDFDHPNEYTRFIERYSKKND